MTDTPSPTPGITVCCDYCGTEKTIPEQQWADGCENKGCFKFGHIMVIPVPEGRKYVKVHCETTHYACINEKDTQVRCQFCEAEHHVDTVSLHLVNGQPIYETAKSTGFIRRRLAETETLRKAVIEEQKNVRDAKVAQKRTEIELTEKVEKLERKMLNQKQSYRNEFDGLKSEIEKKCKDMSKLKVRNDFLEKEVKKYEEEKEAVVVALKKNEAEADSLQDERLNNLITLSEEQKTQIETLKKKCEDLEGVAQHCRDVATLEWKQKVDAVNARDELNEKLKASMAQMAAMHENSEIERSIHLQQQMNWNDLLENVESKFAQTEDRLKTKEAALDESAILLQSALKKKDEELVQVKRNYEEELGRLIDENKKLVAEKKEKEGTPKPSKPWVTGLPTRKNTPRMSLLLEDRDATFSKIGEEQISKLTTSMDMVKKTIESMKNERISDLMKNHPHSPVSGPNLPVSTSTMESVTGILEGIFRENQMKQDEKLEKE